MKKIVYMLVLLILPMIVSATNYTAEDMTIDIGDNWMVFTRDNLENNENLAKFGVDENTMKVQMNTFGMYIDAISTFDNVNYTEMFVFVKSTDEETMNLHKYKDEDALEVGKTLYNKYKPTRMELYKTKRLTYIVAEYTDKVNNKTLYVTDYYTVINNQVVVDLVNDIGGVYFDVPIDMNYADKTQNLHIHLEAGYRKLDGDHAEQLLRFRHNNDMSVGYPMGDLDRTKVQQTFIKEFISQVCSIKNIYKYPKLIQIVLNKTETNLTQKDVLKYITDIIAFDKNNIVSFTAEGEAKYVKGVSYFFLNKYETIKKVSESFK